MTTELREGTILWEPSAQLRERAVMSRYVRWLAEARGLRFDDYQNLWAWSATEIEAYWRSIWDFFRVQASKQPTTTLVERRMPGAAWFPGAELSYPEHVFRNQTDARPAILARSELRPLAAMPWDQLAREVASVAAALREMGVRRGDRVVAYLPNIVEAVVAFLACASLGATWSSCSPDFGDHSVIDRFKQIEPKVLFAVDGYRYGGKDFDRRSNVAAILEALPTVERVVAVPYLRPDWRGEELRDATPWAELLARPEAELRFEQVPFDHPLWVLYSSGTTGLPKAFVHGHGGILVEAFKTGAIHLDLQPDDVFFWFTSTGWVMWNIVVGGLLAGSTIVLFDGNPGYPDLNTLWQLAQDAGITVFGASAAFITACMKAGIAPAERFDVSSVREIGSTGSPLPVEGFVWAYEHVKRDLWLNSISGGTDVVGGFVGGCPLLPVHAGELQSRCLGVNVQAFDESGQPVVDQMGELVITQPMPSMPLRLWNDLDNRRYLESYFDMFPGVWRHGDWIKLTSRGTAVIYGRSDATLNRLGVRMGSSEIYAAVEGVPEVLDSLVIGLDLPHGGYFMPLFVVLREGVVLDEALKATIKARVRSELSPRYVPDEIFAIPDIPRTLSNKKMEVPIKKIFMGIPVEKAIDLDAVQDPAVVHHLAALARELNLFGKG